MKHVLVVITISLTAIVFLTNCPFFSDGAVVDYSRLFNVPITFFSDSSGPNQWEADEGYKQARSFEGSNTPWATQKIGQTTFMNYTDRTVSCNTIGNQTFCN